MLSMFMALIDSAESQSKFEKIYYNYRKQMHYIAKTIVKTDELAEDAVQEAFISIAKRIDHIKDDDDKLVRSYVLTVTKHAAMEIQRGEARNQCTVIDFEVSADDTDSPMEDKYSVFETVFEIKAAIKKMPETYQDVLYMKLVQEMDYDEIADVMHQQLSTVRQQFSRGKRMLMDFCEKEGLYAGV